MWQNSFSHIAPGSLISSEAYARTRSKLTQCMFIIMNFVITKCRKWAQEITIEVILCKYSRQIKLNASWHDRSKA